MGVRNMGEIIRILAIDKNEERVKHIADKLSQHDPGLKIEVAEDIPSLIQLIETTEYDCIITPEEISILSTTELVQKLTEIISLPIIQYSDDSSLPPSVRHQYQSFKGYLTDENNLAYGLFAKRIRRTVKRLSVKSSAIDLNLPDTLRIVVEGNKLFIVDENGYNFWGYEEEAHIDEIAKQLESELKAIQWVSNETQRFISELAELLKYSDIPHQDISDIVYEGYRSLFVKFKNIHESYNEV
jgi:CheY-like chemotaxis protein